MVTAARVLAATALLGWCAWCSAASLTATVDRRELYVNEHAVLTIELRDSDTRLRAEGVDPNIDLTTLAGQFDVGVPRADFRFNIERNRGRATSSVSVELFPKRAGQLRISPFTVEGLKTAAIELRVLPLPPDATPEVFTRGGLAKRELFVGEQTLLFLDLYHRVNLKTAKFGAQLDSQPHEVEAHALPATERTERFGGIEYQVTRTAWAVAALTDQAATFYLPDVWVETEQGRRWRLPVIEERLAVRPLPARASAETLLGRPQLEQSIAAEGAAAKIIPWQITLKAQTALNLLPATLPLPGETTGFKAYFDAAERSLEPTRDGGVQSVATYRGYLLPTAAGELTTPLISLGYLDTATGRLATASLPGRTLRIAAAPADAESAASAEEPRAKLVNTPTSPPGWWRFTAIAFAALWSITAAAWLLSRWMPARRPARQRPGARVSEDPRQRLIAAFGSRTLEAGLLAWEREHGVDHELRNAVRSVQRYYYRRDSGTSEAELRQTVDAIIAWLAGRPAPTRLAAEDPWSPRAFRPAPRGQT